MNNLGKQREILAKFEALAEELEDCKVDHQPFCDTSKSEDDRAIASDLRRAHSRINKRLILMGFVKTHLKDAPQDRLIARDEWNFCPVCGTARPLYYSENLLFFKCHVCEAIF
jgi:hypothetical protein